ncbi:DUF4272 domain-containing protein [Nocardia sp. NPDC049707]|uniref:DUF4272 domain-containing protein n=1 Tax=Nocardia sp. NPDC049707 TaxID=3154735 RepID=UPI003418BD1A
MATSVMARARQHGLEYEFLAPVEDSFDIQFRSSTTVARRILALHGLLGVLFHSDPREIVEWMRAESMISEFTTQERQILAIVELPEDEMFWKQRAFHQHRLTWRAESLNMLLWATGRLDSVPAADQRADLTEAADHLPVLGERLQPFVDNAVLRSRDEILAEMHYYSCLAGHFDTLRTLQEFAPDEAEEYEERIHGVHELLTEERFHSLHWIACAGESDWDTGDTHVKETHWLA